MVGCLGFSNVSVAKSPGIKLLRVQQPFRRPSSSQHQVFQKAVILSKHLVLETELV